ncbi:MAG TPA: hypothetical protein VJ183_15380 [Chloroflexia bacterium]|nr:hypothetical protein [Chloroflexia bacterium]
MSGDGERKSGVQKLFTGRVSPTTRAAMEAESRSWMIRCPYCGHERSVWETGGVRYKAAGNSRQLRRCPQCGKLSWHIIYRRENQQSTDTPLAPLPLADSRRRWLLWVLGLGLLGTVIAAFVAVLLFVIGTLTQPVVTAGDAFMTALKTGNYAEAYALCTPELQKELGSVSGMATLLEPDQPSQWNWTNRSIRNGVGRLDGSLTYANGKTGTVHLVLNQVGNDWKIVSFRMDPT